MKLNGPALGVTFTGVIFVIAGIKGVSVSGAIKDLIQGKNPTGSLANQWSANPSSTPTATTPASGGSVPFTVNSAGYVNPLQHITSFIAQRVDQGVDFAGAGPILAIGDGVVLQQRTGNTGWGPPNGPAPGLWLTYQLTNGPDAGKVVYVAEGANPHVNAGDHIKAGQVIATLNGTSIETGWADSTGSSALSQSPSAGGIGGGNLPAGGTLVGRSFEDLLVSLGVIKANNLGGATGGTLPPGYPR